MVKQNLSTTVAETIAGEKAEYFAKGDRVLQSISAKPMTKAEFRKFLKRKSSSAKTETPKSA